MNCQHSGLKNQRPSIGQVGMLTPLIRAASQSAPDAVRSSHGDCRSRIAKIGAAVISTT